MIHKGRALTFLKDYKTAIIEFENAKKIQPSPVIDRNYLFLIIFEYIILILMKFL
jgi:hypothetical protein